MKEIEKLDKEYVLKQGFRTFMMWEELTGKPISNMDNRLNDILTLFYCSIKAEKSNQFEMSFDDFVDMLDAYQDKITEFTSYVTKEKSKKK